MKRQFILIDLSSHRRNIVIKTIQVACVIGANVSMSIILKNI